MNYIVKAENKVGNTVYAEFDITAEDEWEAVDIGKLKAKKYNKDEWDNIIDTTKTFASYTHIVAYNETGKELASLEVW